MSYYMSDDATEDELREMAAEQRATRPPAPGFGYPAREATLRPASRFASLAVAGVMLSLVIVVMSAVILLTQQPLAWH